MEEGCTDCKGHKKHTPHAGGKRESMKSRESSQSSSSSSSSASSGGSSYSHSSESENDRDKKIKALKEKLSKKKQLHIKAEADLVTLADVEAIKLTRNQFMEMLSFPDAHFDEIVINSFARVVDNGNRYRMCQIVGVKKASQAYNIS